MIPHNEAVTTVTLWYAGDVQSISDINLECWIVLLS